MKTHHTQNGFSLLELLTVMSIMAILSTLAVAGYLSAVRGMAKQRAIGGVSNALVLARQRACTEATKTTVVCFNVWTGGELISGASTSEKRKACTPTYVICKTIGTFTYVNGNILGDEFTPLDRIFGLSLSVQEQQSAYASLRLYNLTRGGWSDVYPTVRRMPYQGGTDAGAMSFPATDPLRTEAPSILLCFDAKKTANIPGGWKVGDAYGIAVSPVAVLPKNIFFGGGLSPDSSNSESSTPPMLLFTFFPDGRAESKTVQLLSLEPTLATFKTIEVTTDGDVKTK